MARDTPHLSSPRLKSGERNAPGPWRDIWRDMGNAFLSPVFSRGEDR